jgi:hypothetical protein
MFLSFISFNHSAALVQEGASYPARAGNATKAIYLAEKQSYLLLVNPCRLSQNPLDLVVDMQHT